MDALTRDRETMLPMIDELRLLIAKSRELSDSVVDSEAWDEPYAGSGASEEIITEEADASRPEGSWPWLSVLLIARWALQLAGREVAGFAAVLDIGAPYPGDVLCRAILEGTSLSWWLLQPDIGSRRRLARALAYRLGSARETERAIKHLELGEDEDEDRSGYGESREEVVNAIESLHLECRDKAPITVDGEELPGYTKRVAALVRAVWPQEKLPYSLLSQVSHAELGGLACGLRYPNVAVPSSAPRPPISSGSGMTAIS